MRLFRRLSALLSVTVLLVGSAITINTYAQSAQEYRQTLFGFINLLEQVNELNGFTVNQPALELAIDELAQLSDDDVQNLLADALPLDELQRLLSDAQSEVNEFQALSVPAIRTIDIPDVDVSPSFCSNTTAAAYFAALSVEKVIKAIFSALKFECLQTVLGENGALLCLAAAIEVIIAEEATELGQFCRDEIRAGKGEAILDLDRNIGAHLNEFIDDTTSSSRATQDSLDDVQADVTTAISNIDVIQSDLDTGFSTIDNDLSTASSDLSILATDLTDIISIADDIQFRVQENQVNIEDVQTRTADLQESTDEIRTDTQSIISTVSDLQASTDGLLDGLRADFNQINQDIIAAALSNPDVVVAEYALPLTSGGQLETAREIVIQAIISLQALGLGNTDAALALVNQGDVAYNLQDYVEAYNLFAQAYQSLTNDSSMRLGGL